MCLFGSDFWRYGKILASLADERLDGPGLEEVHDVILRLLRVKRLAGKEIDKNEFLLGVSV